MTVQELINHLELQPHPEGGFYKETYRSAGSIAAQHLRPFFNGDRHYSTAIYFLLPQGSFSAFHRIKSDECWHFYEGQTLLIHVIENGRYTCIHLGNNLAAGECYQAVVPAGAWFAAEPATATVYALVGCTVAPGFDFADFEMAESGVLTDQFPQQATLIQRLCK